MHARSPTVTSLPHVTMSSPRQTSRFHRFTRASKFYYEIVKYIACSSCQRKVDLLDPQQVLRNRLGDDLVVLDVTTEPLVKHGDNYGSTIIKVTVDVETRGERETLNLVAKMLPSSRWMRKIYECDFTVAKEIFLYEQIVPTYEEIRGEKMDAVPKFYGGRLAIRPGEIFVDEGAVILLENLKESGYVMEVRQEGLSMDHIELVISAIAKFHAIGLAIKQKNPEFYLAMQNYAKPLAMPEDLMGNAVPEILKLIRNCSRLSKYYKRVEKLKTTGENTNCLMQVELKADDPWACLVHRDLWKNNAMFRSEEGQITSVKFFDFQNYCLASPMTDLIYFLCTSMHRDHFERFDEAIELYRISVSDTLRELNCDASMFGKENFERRLREDARSELFHSIMIGGAVEMRSMWEIMMPTVNENLVCRYRKILEVYDEKSWF